MVRNNRLPESKWTYKFERWMWRDCARLRCVEKSLSRENKRSRGGWTKTEGIMAGVNVERRLCDENYYFTFETFTWWLGDGLVILRDSIVLLACCALFRPFTNSLLLFSGGETFRCNVRTHNTMEIRKICQNYYSSFVGENSSRLLFDSILICLI